MNKYQLLTFCVTFTFLTLRSANVPIQYNNVQYEPGIKTVLMTQYNSYERFPAIDLNSSQQLELIFDELKSENDNYQFTFVHCTSNWELSYLRPNEYIAGSFFENVTNYHFSTTTFQVYTHYSIVFPKHRNETKIEWKLHFKSL